eukprot:gene44199-58960_t
MINIMVNGNTTKKNAVGSIYITMVVLMTVIGGMAFIVAKANRSLLMVILTMGIGKMAKDMDMGYSNTHP